MIRLSNILNKSYRGIPLLDYNVTAVWLDSWALGTRVGPAITTKPGQCLRPNFNANPNSTSRISASPSSTLSTLLDLFKDFNPSYYRIGNAEDKSQLECPLSYLMRGVICRCMFVSTLLNQPHRSPLQNVSWTRRALFAKSEQIYFSEVESRPVDARNVIVPMSFFSHQVQQKRIVPFILIADPCYGRSL